MLYNTSYVTVCYIPYVMLYNTYVIYRMICYITHDMLCYLTCYVI